MIWKDISSLPDDMFYLAERSFLQSQAKLASKIYKVGTFGSLK
jgi:hypothetical protein